MKRLLPQSLAGRLIVLLLVSLMAGQVATALMFLENRRSALVAAAREQILVRTAAMARLIEDTPADIHDRILSTASSRNLFFRIDPDPLIPGGKAADDLEAAATLAAIFGPDREVRAMLRGRPSREPDRRDPDRREPERRDAERHDDEGRRDDVRNNDDREPRRGERRRDWLPTAALSVRLAGGRWLNVETVLPAPPLAAAPVLVSTLIIGGLVVLVVMLPVRRITRPLRDLSAAADRFGRGERVARLPETGPREIARTMAAFNAMQDRVARFVGDRTRMLAAISHDLRTPLTTLRLRAEFIDDEEIRDRIVDTVEEMTRMTEATLAFARDEAATEAATPTDLAALCAAVAGEFADQGADVSASGAPLTFAVRPVALRRALRNLVENAVRYGGNARIGLKRSGGDVLITVDDDGPGIPPDRLEAVFEPFVRLDASRSAETGGVGLGLSTARNLVRGHGGDLLLANRAGGGLTATIRLPAS